MPEQGYYLTAETKDRLDRLLNARPVESTPAARSPRTRPTVLVRCDSATAADTLTGSVGAESYPGTVLLGDSQLVAADQEEGDPVWLSMADGSAPTADQAYVCVLSGDVTIDGELRPRAFGQPAGAGAGGGSTGIYRNSYSASPFSGYTPVQSGGAAFYVRTPHDSVYWVTGVLQVVAGGGGLDLSYAVIEWSESASDPTSADTLTMFGLNRDTLAASDRRTLPISCLVTTAGSATRKVGVAYKVNSGSISTIGTNELAVIPITILTV